VAFDPLPRHLLGPSSHAQKPRCVIAQQEPHLPCTTVPSNWNSCQAVRCHRGSWPNPPPFPRLLQAGYSGCHSKTRFETPILSRGSQSKQCSLLGRLFRTASPLWEGQSKECFVEEGDGDEETEPSPNGPSRWCRGRRSAQSLVAMAWPRQICDIATLSTDGAGHVALQVSRPHSQRQIPQGMHLQSKLPSPLPVGTSHNPPPPRRSRCAEPKHA